MSMPYAGDETFLSDEKIQELATQYGTPFYLYDETRIRQRAGEIQRAFAWNPGFAQWFPAAASPNPSIRKLLRQCGCHTAVSSVYDLEIAHHCGYDASEILYHVVYPR